MLDIIPIGMILSTYIPNGISKRGGIMNNQEKNEQNGGYQPQQPNNGYPPQYGQQQPNGYPPQYGQQQPNGYPPQYNQQQPGYPPQYGYQQQPYYPPQPQAPLTASPDEKEAAFSAAGSVFMLILCIIGTINLITGFIGKILSLDIGGLLLFVLDVLIVIGSWITFANGKKKKLASNGISLIRVPYVIQFVFFILSFVTNIVVWVFSFNVISMLMGILTFIFQCICFASVNKTLELARDINQNKSVRGRKAGSFAAIIMIITAVIALINEIVDYLLMEAVKSVLESAGAPDIITKLIGGGGIMTIVVAVVSFIVSISGAIVMLKFGKKIKQING